MVGSRLGGDNRALGGFGLVINVRDSRAWVDDDVLVLGGGEDLDSELLPRRDVHAETRTGQDGGLTCPFCHQPGLGEGC